MCQFFLFLLLSDFFFPYVNELQGANSSHMPIAMKVLEESGGQLPPPPPDCQPRETKLNFNTQCDPNHRNEE